MSRQRSAPYALDGIVWARAGAAAASAPASEPNKKADRIWFMDGKMLGPCEGGNGLRDPRAYARGQLFSGRDLYRGDLVLEGLRVEGVRSAGGRFRLRVHEECDRLAARARQRDIMREVVRHPVHLPGPE